MKEKAQKLFKSHEQFVRYSLIGLTGVALDFVIFLVLFNLLDMNALVANIISTSCGITNNFILNRSLNFKKKDFTLLRFLSFFATGLVGILVSTIIIRIFHDFIGWDANWVKFGAIVVVVLVQYTINKHISFRELTFAQSSSLRVIWDFIKSNWFTIFAFLVAALVFTAYIPKDILGVDEADNFLSAKMILDGSMPYADFFSHHMPTTYFLGIIFYVLGNGDPLGFRVVFAATLFAWLIWNFWLIRKYASKTAAALYVLLVGLAHGLLLQHMMLAETFIFFSVTSIIVALLFVPAERPKQKKWLWTLSVLLASIPLLALSYIYVAIILYIFLLMRIYKGSTKKQLLGYVAIAAVPYILFGLYVVGTGITREFVFSNLRFNALYYGPFFGDMGGNPVLVAYNIVMKTFEQLQTIIAGALTTHFIPFVYLLAFLSLPAALWVTGRKLAAGFVLSLLFFVNARVGLYGPPAIEQTFAASINQHAELYRGLALVFLSLAITYIFSPEAQKWFKKYSIYGLVTVAMALILVIIPVNLIAVSNSYYGGKGAGFIQMIDSYHKLPHENVKIINSVTSEQDKVWMGPIDFLGQSYLEPKQATNYTFYMPWHQAAPKTHDQFYAQLKSEKPLIISWHIKTDDPVYKTPGYQQEMKRFLKQNYYQIKTKDQRFKDLYFLKSDKQTIDSRLKEAGYDIR